MYHLIALLIGFFVDLLLGDPHSIPHPVVWIGKLISAAEKLVRRLFPKTVRGENIAGGVLWVIVGARLDRRSGAASVCGLPSPSGGGTRPREHHVLGRSSRRSRCATRA